MVLVDTSVWIEHFRKGHSLLVSLLEEGEVLTCEHVIGEIALGKLRNRVEILRLLNTLPRSSPVSQDEVMFFIETNKLMGSGIGYIDAQILASASISKALILTLDKNLRMVAGRLGFNCNRH